MGSIYVLKDEQNHYVSDYSICFSKELNKVKFMYSLYLTNGFYYSQTKLQALIKLGNLQVLNEKYNLGKIFRIEKIDRKATLILEHNLGVIKVGVSSIRHVYIDIVAANPPYKISSCKCNINKNCCCCCPYRKIA